MLYIFLADLPFLKLDYSLKLAAGFPLTSPLPGGGEVYPPLAAPKATRGEGEGGLKDTF